MKKKNIVINIILIILIFVLAIVGLDYAFGKKDEVEENDDEFLSDEGDDIYGSVRANMNNGEGIIRVRIVNKEEKPIQGYIFYLLDENGKKVCQFGTDEKGRTGVKGLAYGKYTIIEAYSPEEYQISTESVDVELTEENPREGYKYTKR